MRSCEVKAFDYMTHTHSHTLTPQQQRHGTANAHTHKHTDTDTDANAHSDWTGGMRRARKDNEIERDNITQSLFYF